MTVELAASAAHWEGLAAEADRMGDWERDHGRFDGAYRNRAKTYRDVVRALQLQSDTGIPHCSCCFKPQGLSAKRDSAGWVHS